MKRWLIACLLALPTTAAASPSAPRMWTVDAGLRESFVRDASFDPYSHNDVMGQATLGGSRTLWSNDRFSVAPGLRWDFGSSNAAARGAEAQLLVHRFTLPIEGRLHLDERLFVFGRLAPGGLWQRARVTDASLPESLSHSGWVFAGDASVGAAVRLFGHSPGFWLTPELGYAFAARGASGLSPDVAADDPRQFGQLGLRGVALSGLFFRIGATASF